MTEKLLKHPFIDYLISQKEHRGVMAALRRGLGQSPGAAPEMFPYVVRWLPERYSAHTEATYYLIAALFASHPLISDSGNMGGHLHSAVLKGANQQSVERRFVALLNCHPDDLGMHLRQMVSFLKSNDVAINWQQLFDDLLHWDHPDHYIQKRWAGSFWVMEKPISDEPSEPLPAE